MKLARQAMDAFRRRDRTAFLAAHDKNVQVSPVRDWPESFVRGAEAAWDLYVKNFGVFEVFNLADADSVDASGDKVLLHYRVTLSERGIAAGIDFDYWSLLAIRQGRIVRAQWFKDRVDAREAAGLGE